MFEIGNIRRVWCNKRGFTLKSIPQVNSPVSKTTHRPLTISPLQRILIKLLLKNGKGWQTDNDSRYLVVFMQWRNMTNEVWDARHKKHSWSKCELSLLTVTHWVTREGQGRFRHAIDCFLHSDTYIRLITRVCVYNQLLLNKTNVNRKTYILSNVFVRVLLCLFLHYVQH